MSRVTAAGRATVWLLCRVFAISRQAYYATQRAPAAGAQVVRLPVCPDVTPAATVLVAIKEILATEAAWGCARCGRRCGGGGCGCRAGGCGR